MKLFTILFLTCFSLFSLSTKADVDPRAGSLAGIVTTSDGKPAAYVNVSLPQINKGATTNEEGRFEIRGIKPGTYRIRVSFAGLKPLESTITITAGATTRQNFTLPESASQLNEVTITGANNANKPLSIGKADIRPLDLPQSVGIVSSQVIQDQ